MRIAVPVGVAAVAVALGVAACTSTTAGTASFAGSQPPSAPTSPSTPGPPSSTASGQSSSSAPATSSAPPATSSAPPTSSSPAPAPSSAPASSSSPPPARLQCPAKAVRPKGAPYCYVVPAGFQPVTRARLGSARYPSGVAIDAKNGLFFGVFRAPADTDTLDDTTLTVASDAAVASQLSGSVKFDSKHGRLTHTPDQTRAITYTGVESGTKVTFIFVFRGHTKVQLNCQATDKAAMVARGCSSALASLKVVSLS